MKRAVRPILVLLIILAGISKANFALSDCSINSTSINFGNYDVFSNSAVDSAGTITIRCTSDVVKANVTMGPSSASGTINPRKMKRLPGTDFLEYNIFINVTRTVIFGDGTGGTTVVYLQGLQVSPSPGVKT